jgi:hypothetical protein
MIRRDAQSLCVEPHRSSKEGETRFPMNLREGIRDWSQPIHFLGQNPVSLTGAVITTSRALTTIAFWFYEIFLPEPTHPYIGILVFLILPAIFVLGLVLIPLGIWLRRRSLRGSGQLPAVFPAIDLRLLPAAAVCPAASGQSSRTTRAL